MKFSHLCVIFIISLINLFDTVPCSSFCNTQTDFDVSSLNNTMDETSGTSSNSHGTTSRTISNIMKHTSVSEGGGVIVRRTIGIHPMSYLDPFLLLDEFRSSDANDYIAGFPDHPHRGFETVTYMLEGSMEHKDNKGNSGVLTPGSVQWMTAGRGIVHSEMPKQNHGKMWGFQLWVNLPSKHKMISPRYQDISPNEIPIVETERNVKVVVIAGTYNGIKGPVKDIVSDPIVFDVSLPKGETFKVKVEKDHTIFAYLFDGYGQFGDKKVSDGYVAHFNNDGDMIEVKTDESNVRFLLIGGKPINEPIARRGPFVMNTQEEIIQAYDDYRQGKF